MTPTKRVAALAGGAVTALSAAGLAFASPAEAPPGEERLTLRSFPERTQPPPPPARPRHRFPVRGAAGYGEAGARFGADRGGRSHEGQDVFAPAGTPLVAVSAGVVLETGDDGGRGNYVGLYSPETRRTYVYLHMQSPAEVRPGTRVRPGRRLGRVGCTGSCFGDHLHFEVRKGRTLSGPALDPLPLLRRWAKQGA